MSEETHYCYMGHADCWDRHESERIADEVDWESERNIEIGVPLPPTSIRIKKAHFKRMLALAQMHHYEICGLLSCTPDGEPAEMYEAVNVAAQPAETYSINIHQQCSFFTSMDDARTQLAAIYHSHPRSAPVPSTEDILKAFYPDAVYIIVGRNPDAGFEYMVRAYSIIDGEVSNVLLDVV